MKKKISIIFIMSYLVVSGCSAVVYAKTRPVNASSTSFEDNWNITITLDQKYYYPGERPYIYGQITLNGTGTKAGYCTNLIDSNGTITWGICGMSNATGFFMSHAPTLPESPLGTWTVEADLTLHPEIKANKTFELVNTTVIPDAHGPYSGKTNKPVQFTGTVTGGKPDNYTWLWTFGDGNISMEQNPVHSYETPGIYLVNLTVMTSGNYSGNTTTTSTITQSVTPLTITSITGGIGLTFILTNQGDSSVENITWTFRVTCKILLYPPGGVLTGTIPELPSEGTEKVRNFVFGLGPGTITVNATCAEGTVSRSVSAFLLGPFILGVK